MILQLSLMFLQHDINRQLSYSVDLREKKKLQKFILQTALCIYREWIKPKYRKGLLKILYIVAVTAISNKWSIL